jgi:hypothetical protein
MVVKVEFVICVARKGLWWNAWHETRGFAALRTLAMIGVAPVGLLGSCGILTSGFATLRTLAMIGVAPGGAFTEDWNYSHR